MSTAEYESVLSQVKQLNSGEQLRLLAEIEVLVKGAGPNGKRSILELSGLGAEIWKGIDAQEYVRKERESWNG